MADLLEKMIPPTGFVAGAPVSGPLEFNIFIAYPRCAKTLAEAVKRACEEHNNRVRDNSCVIRPKMWDETSRALPLNVPAQAQIEANQGASDACQILFVVCRFRIGEGTRGELERALQADPKPAIYWLVPRAFFQSLPGGPEGDQLFKDWKSQNDYIEKVRSQHPKAEGLVMPVEAETDEALAREFYEDARKAVENETNRWLDRARQAAQPAPPAAGSSKAANGHDSAPVAPAADVADTQLPRSRRDGPPVYKGLAPYGVEDADVFFGRVDESERYVRRLDQGGAQALLLQGTSGVGKSSLVYAGILPRLRNRQGGPPIESLTMTPGADPFMSMARNWKTLPGFPGEATRPDAALARDLADPEAFLRHLDALIPLRSPQDRRALFVDQFEELLMGSQHDPEELIERRERFAGFLVDYLNDNPRNLLIATIRSDRMDLLNDETWRALGGLFDGCTAMVYPPDLDRDVDDIVRKPAEQVGWTVEDELVDRLREDIELWKGHDWPALLSLILDQMIVHWRKSGGASLPPALTLDLYERVGRMGGAVQKLTAHAMEHLEDAGDETDLDGAFGLLVRIDDDGNPTKARINPAEVNDDDPAFKTVKRLVDLRLVRAESERELSHDILFREWPELRNWVEEEAGLLGALETLETGCRKWIRLGKDSAELLSKMETVEEGETALDRHGVRERQFPELRKFLDESRQSLERKKLANAILQAEMADIVAARRKGIRLGESDIKERLARHPQFYYAIYPESVTGVGQRRPGQDFASNSAEADPDRPLSKRALAYFDKRLEGSATNNFRLAHFAALGGNVSLLKHLNSLGVDMDAKSEKKSTPFHLAVYANNRAAAEWFLEASETPGEVLAHANREGITALHWAAIEGHADLLSWLIERGGDTEARNTQGLRPIDFAASNGKDACVIALMDAGSDIGIPNEAGRTAVHLAARHGHDATLRTIFAQRPASELLALENNEGNRPLDFALLASKDQVTPARRTATLRLLLDAGADPNHGDREGQKTALHKLVNNTATTAGQAQLLLAAGAAVDARDSDGHTPFADALRLGRADIAEQIFVVGLDRNDATHNAQTLMDALSASAFQAGAPGSDAPGADLAKSFLDRLMHGEHALDLDFADKAGNTLAHAGARADAPIMLEWLQERGVPLDTPDEKGNTPLMLAAREEALDAVETLLDHGAEAARVNQDGETVASALLRHRPTLLRQGASAPSGARPRLTPVGRSRRLPRARRFRTRSREDQLEKLDSLVRRVVDLGAGPPAWHAFETDADGAVTGLGRITGTQFVEQAFRPAPEARPWPLEPVAPGDWQALSPEAAPAELASLWEATERLHSAGFTHVSEVRALAPSFYPGCRLLEARLERDGETLGCVSWLRHGSDLTVFNGTSPGVHALNKAVPVNLSDRQAALDYLRFFCAIVHGNEGAFRVIETPGQLRLLPDLPEGVAGRVRAYARPAGDWHDQRAPEREDETDGNSYVEALVLYSNALFLSWFKVLGSGMIEMVNDEPVVLDLPVEIERFDGVLRRLEPIQSGDSPSFSDDKPTSDNPKDAKDDTAPARNSATPGVADSAPPPEPASTEKTDLPAPPRSAKRGGWLIALVLLAALGAAAGYWALTGMPRP